MLFNRNKYYRIRDASLYAGILLSLFCFTGDLYAQSSPRQDISLNENWLTTATSNDEVLPVDYFKNDLDTKNWKKINVPHNWDGYEGYRRLLHGNRHGDAWYRKTIIIKKAKTGKRFFLYFEGVGSYATVYLNDQKVGEHAGGRTTFTIDVTDQLKTDGSANLLAVRSWHPSNIKDLPWVCGGCSDERGFSEGSQPMGIFRPVHLLITNETRIVPFGVHA
ncbi:MAG: glycoside hydrolase family 2, partial [Chitinophagaceae bacterium]|nr:glycoside hydrolase family 2 [Chitinophagaceae bacterium]